MLIVADENMPFAEAAFRTLGDVRLMPGRAMTREAVRDAEILAVRSVTKVNRELLEGTAVRFVGTATIGTNHVDEEYVKETGIAFTSAPGCNANSVSEYIAAALLVLSGREGERLAGKSIGIVGVGNVGSRVAAKAEALGMRVVLNDPPLQRKTGDEKYRPIEEIPGCDVVTLHVPLEKDGPDPTYHLADDDFIAAMKPGAALINSSRGAVVDNPALLTALESEQLGAAVLDVWEGEPLILPGLLKRVALGTPHIAGYSLDGKINGTTMVYEAACRFLGEEPTWKASDEDAPVAVPELQLDVSDRAVEDILREAVLAVYPIERDDAALRKVLDLPRDAQGNFFDNLRKNYPLRREFPNTRVRFSGGKPSDPLTVALRHLGFRVRD